MQPLVSVVVPVFNGMPHLKSLTQALLEQDYPNIEFVFTDGGSTDGSADFIETLKDPRVRLVRMPAGTTAAANWTAATTEAAGDFIKLICQDDLIYPRTISLQVDDLLNHPNAVMAVGQRDIIDAKGAVIYHRRGLSGIHTEGRAAIPGDMLIRTSYIRGTNVIGEPLTVLFRRGPLMQSLPWNDSHPLMLDLTMYERVAHHGEAVVRLEAIGAFRVSAQSWSTRLATVQRQQFRAWQEAYEDAAETPVGRRARVQALVAMEYQVLLRRLAYRFLKLRKSFH